MAETTTVVVKAEVVAVAASSPSLNLFSQGGIITTVMPPYLFLCYALN